MDQFEYNAPQFTDFFAQNSDDDAEKYFDVDHEFDLSQRTMDKNLTNSGEESEDAFKSLEEVDNVLPKTPGKTPRRKSRMTEYGIIKSFEGLSLKTPLPKEHNMKTRLDKLKSPALELRNRRILRDEETENGEVKIKKRKACDFLHEERPEKYICMAEAIEKFQKTTPARYHTRPRNAKVNFSQKNASRKCTVPMSPHLKVVHRNRKVEALSRQQRESLEVEEMKKHQIKAHPLNEKIFKPPTLNISHQSHVTEIQPFNLTEFKKKIEQPSTTVVKFTARPIPKGLFGKKDDKKNTSAPNLIHSISNIPNRHRVPVISKEKENKVQLSKSFRKGPISIKPFSFDERDRAFLKRKETKIKEAIEEEKKAREFHANPLPKFSKHFPEKSKVLPTLPQPFHLSADDKGQANKEKWAKQVEEEKRLMKEATMFKARPSTVLTQKPFVPSKTEHHSLEIRTVNLNTELRSKERALFDKEVKERMAFLGELQMQREQDLKRREEEEVAELRKKLVHKALPVPNYKNITVELSKKPLTVPQSPHNLKREGI